MTLPANLANLKFDLRDCIIEVAKHSGKERPVQFGVTNGEVDFSEHPGEDLESIMNGVTVTHIPTRLSVTVSKFLPFRNRQIAIQMLKKQVEERIAQVIQEYERRNKDV